MELPLRHFRVSSILSLAAVASLILFYMYLGHSTEGGRTHGDILKRGHWFLVFSSKLRINFIPPSKLKPFSDFIFYNSFRVLPNEHMWALKN